MRPARNFEQWQINFLAENASNMTLKELSNGVNIPLASVQKYCKQNQLLTKKAHNKTKQEVATNKSHAFIRPPAEYGQLPSPYGIASSLK